MSKFIRSAAWLTFTGLALIAAACSTRDVEPSEGQGTVTANLADSVKRGELVISQVYAGGGAFNAPFKRDFVELFNRSDHTIDLAGLSLQIANASSAFTSANSVALSGSVPTGGYFLVAAEEDADPFGADLPKLPDLEWGNSLTISSGKVALVPTTASLDCGASSKCPKDKLLDLVGYGGASDSEGFDKVSELDAVSAALRKDGGCLDNDENKKDFSVGEPKPRFSSDVAAPCPPRVRPGVDAAAPFGDPPLGAESPYDAGARRDAGAGPSGAASEDSGGCALAHAPRGSAPSTAVVLMGIVTALVGRGRARARRGEPRE